MALQACRFRRIYVSGTSTAAFAFASSPSDALIATYVLARRIQTRSHSRLHSTGATRCLPDRGILVYPALPVELCRPNYTVVFAVS